MNLENYINVEELPLSLSVRDVATALNISLNSSYQLFHSKCFPYFRVGKRGMRVTKLAFIEWMKNPNSYERKVG